MQYNEYNACVRRVPVYSQLKHLIFWRALKAPVAIYTRKAQQVGLVLV